MEERINLPSKWILYFLIMMKKLQGDGNRHVFGPQIVYKLQE